MKNKKKIDKISIEDKYTAHYDFWDAIKAIEHHLETLRQIELKQFDLIQNLINLKKK